MFSPLLPKTPLELERAHFFQARAKLEFLSVEPELAQASENCLQACFIYIYGICNIHARACFELI